MKEGSLNNKTDDIISDHRKMLIMSGNLSDFQLENMKNWPFILFDDIDSVKLNYDFTTKVLNENGNMSENIGSGKVCYNVVRHAGFKPESSEADKIATLTQWTKFLFWSDTEVEVKFE